MNSTLSALTVAPESRLRGMYGATHLARAHTAMLAGLGVSVYPVGYIVEVDHGLLYSEETLAATVAAKIVEYTP